MPKKTPSDMNTENEKAFFQDDLLSWEPVGEGIRRKIMGYDDKIMLVKVAFEEGAVGELHHHFHSQVAYVESGEFELTIGEKVQLLKSGDSYYVPPNVIHGCVCKKPGVIIDIFSPLREDFITS